MNGISICIGKILETVNVNLPIALSNYQFSFEETYYVTTCQGGKLLNIHGGVTEEQFSKFGEHKAEEGKTFNSRIYCFTPNNSVNIYANITNKTTGLVSKKYVGTIRFETYLGQTSLTDVFANLTLVLNEFKRAKSYLKKFFSLPIKNNNYYSNTCINNFFFVKEIGHVLQRKNFNFGKIIREERFKSINENGVLNFHNPHEFKGYMESLKPNETVTVTKQIIFKYTG